MKANQSQSLVLLALTVAILATAAVSSATTIRVRTLDDLDSANEFCSLREAIIAANTDALYRDCQAGNGADVIELTIAGTVTLVSDLPAITDAVTIRGLGVDTSTVDGARWR